MPRNARAVAAIFEAKGRPRFNPLIVHVADAAAAGAPRQADRAWPAAAPMRSGRGRSRWCCSGSRIARSPISPRPACRPLRCAFPRTRSRSAARRGRLAGCRAERQSLGACQPDHGGARGGRSRRPGCHDPGWRADRRRPGIDGGRCHRETCPSSCGAGVSRARRSPRSWAWPIEVATGDADQAGLARHAGAALRAGDAPASQRARCARRRSAAGIRCAHAALTAAP